ncbi:MAG: SDR family oxidoreductase [Deltaproteobacteria bacterium]|nr:SDR family oxidoreductase [Deltaproteobacteria bacterium]
MNKTHRHAGPHHQTGALITGASRGLGLALASALARQGARVALVARDAQRLNDVVRGLKAEGLDVHAVVGDVADKRATHKIAGAAAALVGPIDLLINNASSLGPVPLRPLIDTDCESLEETLATNVVGPFRLAKVVVGSMLLRRSGIVVNLSSDAAVAAYANWGAYSASKAASDHLTRVWGEELKGSGVHVVAVDPGEMRTQMHRDAIPDADEAALQDPRDVAARILSLIERVQAGDVVNGARVEASAFALEGVRS